MDFMFEDEVDEVGSDVEAYCPKCKGDTTHVVISKYEDEIRRVQCNPCGDVHSFRKPRGDVEDDVPEPIAAKKRAMMKKPTFDEFFAKHSDKNAKPYEFREHYHENVIVTHPKFGKGFVSEIVSDSKVEVTFKDSRRVLVHNRKDMPGLPLAAEGDGIAAELEDRQEAEEGRQGQGEGAAKATPRPKKPVAPGAAARGQGARSARAKPARSVRVGVGQARPAGGRQAARPRPRSARSSRRGPVTLTGAHREPLARCAGRGRPESGTPLRAGEQRDRAASASADQEDVEVVEGVGVDGDGEAAEPEDEAEEAARPARGTVKTPRCSGSP